VTRRKLSVPDRVELNNGGGNRRDYGPAGCAGIVYSAVAAAAVLLHLLLKAGAR
jgi:hypothetical protein